MTKYFVTADTHGFLTELQTALKEKGFDIENDSHILILCGDAFDRGDEAAEMFEFLKLLHSKNRLIYIRGNHEDLLLDCVNELAENRGCASSHHYSNGTVDTIIQLKEKDLLDSVLDFIQDVCVDYFELEDYIFIHGFIPCIKDADTPFWPTIEWKLLYNPDWRTASVKDWENARWINGIDACLVDDIYEETKKIVCGHWHCSRAYHLTEGTSEFESDAKFNIFESEHLIALDACTAYTRKVNVLVIEKDC